MNQTETTQESKPEAAPKASFTETIVEFSLTWADAGLGLSKTALETSARALDRTAKRVESLQERLKTTRAPAKEAAEDGAAPKAPSA